jgi:hypothetical protein
LTLHLDAAINMQPKYYWSKTQNYTTRI